MPSRPSELVYAEDERPPVLSAIALGFQHVAVICPYFVMVALVIAAARLPHEDGRSAMGLAMIAVAILTVLQSLRLGPIGSGHLCPPVVSAIYLPSAISAAATFGLPVVCGMAMFAGACEAVIGRMANSLRKFFPAVVSGVVIVAVGIELGKIGFGVAIEPFVKLEDQAGEKFATAVIVVAVTTGLAIWAKGQIRQLCVLTGVLTGYAISLLLQVFPPGTARQLYESPFFALPDPAFLSYDFEPTLMLPFAIAGLASGLRAVGVLTTCQQINDADWHRPDMKRISAGVTADGIGCAVGGALGTPGMSASPSLVGLEKTTGVTSRSIAWVIAAWLVLLACLPQFSSLIINMPRPVMGAALFFNGSLMIVAGVQLIVSRPVTLRATVIVGFSLVTAISVMVFPEFYKGLPPWLHQITGTEITVTVVLAVGLYALFRLGAWHYLDLRLGSDAQPITPAAFDDFFVKQAAAWKISSDDSTRIRAVVDLAIEHIAPAADGPLTILLGTDTFDLTVTISYRGNLPVLQSIRPPAELVEEQSFVSGLSGYFSGVHADYIERFARKDECEVKLVFRL
ncbi:MAG: uracil-xanthine permease family protein [Xanthobacteraceae bacterium]